MWVVNALKTMGSLMRAALSYLAALNVRAQASIATTSLALGMVSYFRPFDPAVALQYRFQPTNGANQPPVSDDHRFTSRERFRVVFRAPRLTPLRVFVVDHGQLTSACRPEPCGTVAGRELLEIPRDSHLQLDDSPRPETLFVIAGPIAGNLQDEPLTGMSDDGFARALMDRAGLTCEATSIATSPDHPWMDVRTGCQSFLVRVTVQHESPL